MANATKSGKPKKPPTQRQMRIAKIREVDKDQRPPQMAEELSRLMKEEARDRFLRLCEKRVNSAVKAISNVARMGNKLSYDYTPEEAAAIVDEIVSAGARLRGAFGGQKASVGFQLPKK